MPIHVLHDLKCVNIILDSGTGECNPPFSKLFLLSFMNTTMDWFLFKSIQIFKLCHLCVSAGGAHLGFVAGLSGTPRHAPHRELRHAPHSAPHSTPRHAPHRELRHAPHSTPRTTQRTMLCMEYHATHYTENPAQSTTQRTTPRIEYHATNHTAHHVMHSVTCQAPHRVPHYAPHSAPRHAHIS